MSNNKMTASEIIAARMAKAIQEKGDEIDQDYEKHLEGLRYERFVREELADMSPEEQAAYHRENGPLATISRLAHAAMRESDEKFMAAIRERHNQEYDAWAKSQTGGMGRSYEVLQKHAEEGNALYQERLKARERRLLEAEVHAEDLARVWSYLDADERAILKRMLDEETDELSKIRRWKQANRNPIADVNDTTTLYRMATQKARYQEYVPPTSEVENVNSARTLYAMAMRDLRNKQRK